MKLEETVARLDAEAAAQKKHVAAVAAALAADAPAWLAGVADPAATVPAFLERCALPRALHSAADAAYVAAFIRTAHTLRVPGFSTLFVYDRALKDVLPVVLAATDREAAALGVFLRDVLATLEAWRTDGGLYARECDGAPGFAVDPGAAVPGAPTLPRADYVRLAHKWQHKAARVFRAALDTREQRRSALLVLNACVRVFPSLAGVGGGLRRTAERVRDDDDREDVKTLANMYVMALTREAGSGRMLSSDAFAAGAKAAAPTDAPPARARPPKKLSPSAPEFVPGSGGSAKKELRAEAGAFVPKGKVEAAAAKPVAAAPAAASKPPPATDRKRGGGAQEDVYVPPAKRARADGGTLRGEAPPPPPPPAPVAPRGGGGDRDRDRRREPAPKRGREDEGGRGGGGGGSGDGASRDAKRSRGDKPPPPPPKDPSPPPSDRGGGSSRSRSRRRRGGRGSDGGEGDGERGGERDRARADDKPTSSRGGGDRDRGRDRDRRRAASPVRFTASCADTDKAERVRDRRRGGGGGGDDRRRGERGSRRR